MHSYPQFLLDYFSIFRALCELYRRIFDHIGSSVCTIPKYIKKSTTYVVRYLVMRVIVVLMLRDRWRGDANIVLKKKKIFARRGIAV